MSGAAATAERAHPPGAAPPAQLALDGVPPPAYPLRISIVGYLKHDAEVRTSTDGRVHLAVVVLQARGLPFAAMYHAEAPGRAGLERLAALMRRDTPVVLIGNGLQPATVEGEPMLRVLRCDASDAVLEPGMFFAWPDAARHAGAGSAHAVSHPPLEPRA